MAKQPKRPAFTHCKITKTSNVRAPWRVWFSVEKDGKPSRVFKSFADEAKAYAFAQEKELEISNHGVRYGDLPSEVRRAFDFYRDETAELAELGIDVPRFENLISSSLAEIRLRHREIEEKQESVAEGVEQFIEYKSKEVKSLQLGNLRDQLKRFAQEFGERAISSLNPVEIEEWLLSLRSLRNPDKLPLPPLLVPRTRNHYRATLHAFFSYAAEKGRDWCKENPITWKPTKIIVGKPKVYSPADTAQIIQTALDHKPDLVPVLALGFFAGLRVSEALELDLGSLSQEEDELLVPDGKTGERYAPFIPACKAWIFAQQRRRGKAWMKSRRSFVSEMQELFTLSKIEQVKNGARHSFVSYRVGETRNVASVADECGHSPTTLQKHYRRPVSSELAKIYFDIRPTVEGESKVTDIETGRASA